MKALIAGSSCTHCAQVIVTLDQIPRIGSGWQIQLLQRLPGSRCHELYRLSYCFHDNKKHSSGS